MVTCLLEFGFIVLEKSTTSIEKANHFFSQMYSISPQLINIKCIPGNVTKTDINFLISLAKGFALVWFKEFENNPSFPEENAVKQSAQNRKHIDQMTGSRKCCHYWFYTFNKRTGDGSTIHWNNSIGSDHSPCYENRLFQCIIQTFWWWTSAETVQIQDVLHKKHRPDLCLVKISIKHDHPYQMNRK